MSNENNLNLTEMIKEIHDGVAHEIKSNRPTSGYIILNEALGMAINALEKQIPKQIDISKGEKNYF